MDVDARIDALHAEVDRLQGRVEDLEAAMGMNFVTPLGWGLTGAEMRIFGVLLAREMATKDALMAALYRDLGKDEAQVKIVDVLVCKMRKKLVPLGIVIETIWGQGYRLTPAAKAQVQALMSPAADAA